MARPMKDSGVQWIGMVPNTMKMYKAKYLFSFQKGKLPTSVNNDGLGLPCIGASEMNGASPTNYTEDDLPRCEKNDVLLLWDGANAGLVSSGHEGIVSSTVCRARLISNDFTPRFAYYTLKSAERYYREKVGGTTIPHMSSDYIDDTYILGFNIEEQKSIAAFLDAKCAAIDDVLAKTQESIEEYKKLKQAVITEAVTKGVRGKRPMKDSGIDWIGQIPKDWSVHKVKRLLFERKERSETGLEEPLSMSQVLGLVPTTMLDSIPNMAASFVGAKLTFVGDLVFNKLKAHLGVFSVSRYDGLVSPDYAVYYGTGLVDLNYLEFLFKTPQCIHEFKKRITGVGAGLSRLYTDDLFSISCAIPSIDEQKEISQYLLKKRSEIDSLIEKKQQFIDELTAYKKSLIYEYVTGKREVPV